MFELVQMDSVEVITWKNPDGSFESVVRGSGHPKCDEFEAWLETADGKAYLASQKASK